MWERERKREIPTAVDSSHTLHRTATLSSLSVSVWTRAPPAQSGHSFNSGLILGNNIVKYLQPIVVHYSAVQSCVGLSERERERERLHLGAGMLRLEDVVSSLSVPASPPDTSHSPRCDVLRVSARIKRVWR